MTRQRDRNRGRTNEKGKKKNKGFKAGAIAFGVAAVLYAAIFPLYRISDFLLCGALSMLAGKIISIMGSGLDLTTHNKQDQKEQPAPPEELPLSGDEAADAVIARGQEMLHQIRAENDAIPDQVLSGQFSQGPEDAGHAAAAGASRFSKPWQKSRRRPGRFASS